MGNCIVLAALFILLFALFMPVYLRMSYGKELTGSKKVLALTFKALATFMAVLVALFAYTRRGDTFSLHMLAGIVICMAADVFIGINFLLGVFSFFAGHLLYGYAAIDEYGVVWWKFLIAFAIGAAALVLYLGKHLEKAGSKLPPLLVYGCVLISMFSLFAPQVLTGKPADIALACGAAFFLVSDITLAKNMFVNSTRLSDTVSLSCYYLGQYLLALGVFIPTMIEK